jgi:hypothetical protein
MKKTSIMLRMLLSLGLVLAPLYPRTFAASGDMMMRGVHMNSGDMASSAEPPSGTEADQATAPCHGGTTDGDKACPCMAACMSLSAQCLPFIVSTLARVVVVGQPFAIHSEAQLASLAGPPPARPPRA